MNRKGPWEGYRRKASRPSSPTRLPLRAHFHRERGVWVRGSHYNQSSCENATSSSGTSPQPVSRNYPPPPPRGGVMLDGLNMQAHN